MLRLVFNENLIDKTKYNNPITETTKCNNLRRYPLKQHIIIYNKGDGYICEDIALGMGVLNKTNKNPNKKLIKRVAEYAKIKKSGEIRTEVYNESNGSMNGFHENIKLKYSTDAIMKILEILEKSSRCIKDDLWYFKDVKFRVKKGL